MDVCTVCTLILHKHMFAAVCWHGKWVALNLCHCLWLVFHVIEQCFVPIYLLISAFFSCLPRLMAGQMVELRVSHTENRVEPTSSGCRTGAFHGYENDSGSMFETIGFSMVSGVPPSLDTPHMLQLVLPMARTGTSPFKLSFAVCPLWMVLRDEVLHQLWLSRLSRKTEACPC